MCEATKRFRGFCYYHDFASVKVPPDSVDSAVAVLSLWEGYLCKFSSHVTFKTNGEMWVGELY